MQVHSGWANEAVRSPPLESRREPAPSSFGVCWDLSWVALQTRTWHPDQFSQKPNCRNPWPLFPPTAVVEFTILCNQPCLQRKGTFPLTVHSTVEFWGLPLRLFAPPLLLLHLASRLASQLENEIVGGGGGWAVRAKMICHDPSDRSDRPRTEQQRLQRQLSTALTVEIWTIPREDPQGHLHMSIRRSCSVIRTLHSTPRTHHEKQQAALTPPVE
ncbi:hypothetical protein VTK26DRAFT_1738 [Humicola hyalothermophila]